MSYNTLNFKTVISLCFIIGDKPGQVCQTRSHIFFHNILLGGYTLLLQLDYISFLFVIVYLMVMHVDVLLGSSMECNYMIIVHV